MTDTIQNIPLPSNTWVNLYSQSGRTVGDKIAVFNNGAYDIRLTVKAEQPDQDYNAFIVLKPRILEFSNQAGDSGAWAYSPNINGVVSVRRIP